MEMECIESGAIGVLFMQCTQAMHSVIHSCRFLCLYFVMAGLNFSPVIISKSFM